MTIFRFETVMVRLSSQGPAGVRIHAAAARATPAGEPAPPGPQASQAAAGSRYAPAAARKLNGSSCLLHWLPPLEDPYHTCPARA